MLHNVPTIVLRPKQILRTLTMFTQMTQPKQILSIYIPLIQTSLILDIQIMAMLREKKFLHPDILPKPVHPKDKGLYPKARKRQDQMYLSKMESPPHPLHDNHQMPVGNPDPNQPLNAPRQTQQIRDSIKSLKGIILHRMDTLITWMTTVRKKSSCLMTPILTTTKKMMKARALILVAVYPLREECKKMRQ